MALSATAVGSMEAVMAMTADYLKQRVQFGQTLSKFQALQHRMAEVFIETGQRTFFTYLMRPVIDSFSRAFRER